MSCFTLKKSLLLGVFVIFLCFFDKFCLPKLFIFSPERLQELSVEAIKKHKNDTLGLMNELAKNIKKEYGNAVLPLDHSKWFFNNAGNAMGAMIILHMSFSEYLIFFGTAIGTDGHSGVHFSNDYFTILRGEQKVFAPGELKPTIYKPGMQTYLPRGKKIHYSMIGESWALELAQGWIPSMLPFGLIETFFTTLDFSTFWSSIRYASEAMFKSFINGKF
ncbi:hypothetical protein T552_00750 [Pneumocystis carinii B80]|uniref:C-8 sterol isomerase n=1 Tax=Pneumocystis carinii (strain B80) TaxID=1408658 RepID=A0A0W4ZPH0_PNEC8|nr:hypothetical protein T552_00750 [Pneumocystis carinii B80]KTW30274.1 hypothetical protein T552_00750 [Pneumocystis carinii B80]